MTTPPQPGDIGVVSTSGFVAAGIRVITRAPVNHAFVYIGGGHLIEGDPKGAQWNDVTSYPGALWLGKLSVGLTDAQRTTITQWAVAHIGTPYSWIDDAEIGFTDLFGWAPGFMRKRLRSDKTLMCSQLCVAAYAAAGVTLFPGRPAGAVSPGDLYKLNEAK